MAEISDIIKQYIRNYMTEKFFLEGENKDYYFGKSLLNDDLTVFYNDMGDITSTLRSSISQAIEYGFDELTAHNLMRWSSQKKDLSCSAFCIPVFSKSATFKDSDGNVYYCNVNYMKTGVLEKAIEENPERWELYKRYQNNNK